MNDLPAPIPPAPNAPWSICAAEGTPDGLRRHLAERDDVPAHWREALGHALEAVCGPEANWVKLHAHFAAGSHGHILTLHLLPSEKLL